MTEPPTLDELAEQIAALRVAVSVIATSANAFPDDQMFAEALPGLRGAIATLEGLRPGVLPRSSLAPKMPPGAAVPLSADDEPDMRFERGLRQQLETFDATWMPHTNDIAFVFRLLDAARRAYRDGFAAGVQAERARIIADLREPSDELVTIAAKAECDDHVGAANSVWDSGLTDRDGRMATTRRVLRALADHLEHQTTTVGRKD